MKTVIYKKRGRMYECIKLIDAPSKMLRIVLAEPIDAKIKLRNRLLSVRAGVATVDLDEVGNGDFEPVLLLPGYSEKMENLLIYDGCVSRKAVSDEFVRELSERCAELEEKIKEITSSIKELYSKTEDKLNF